ncbi:class I SAM-dependent methyltransferase [Bradyrhizobium sp. Ai1a-2]|uniref:class I SAM-dependent methyltransferase n=1 Tax=Bradyrhizobium sp. Ai1a-2 TaxID=196490 RepID=UPI00041E63E3|nr:class I SAM-dependent methyltransferase [Bradyrhizobium sp. Ai1a-2]
MTHFVSDTYNIVAGQVFQRHYELPIRAHAERHTFFAMLGDITGMSVLDLACGEGWYPRQMKAQGAKHVTGIDLSENLINFARFREREDPFGIEYRVDDITRLGQIGEFDLVTAQLMFNYAASPAQFQGICQAIAVNLRPGGRFVSIGFNPFMSPAAPSMRKYGVNLALHDPLRNGDGIKGQIYLDEGDTPTLEISHYYWEPATYESNLRAAGMVTVEWHPAEISPDGLRDLGSDYWDDFRKFPFLIGISAIKA